MNHTNLEMILGNQAKTDIAQELQSCDTCIYPGPVDVGSTAQQCNSCEGYCNYTAKEETVVQTTKKEDSVSTHNEGGDLPPLKSPDYMAGYIDGYTDCHDFVNGKLDKMLGVLK